MAQYISKSALVAEIEKQISAIDNFPKLTNTQITVLEGNKVVLTKLLSFINTIEVIDPYEHLIQYSSREDGIKAHAETYSWNIESELFQQLTPEQQKLWRKEIEQACISGGYCGLNLQKDRRYDDTPKVKEVDLEKEIKEIQRKYKTIDEYEGYPCTMYANNIECIAKHFFELGLKTQHSSIDIPNIDDILEEDGIDPNSKTAKIFKESYYMALERLIAQKGEEI